MNRYLYQINIGQRVLIYATEEQLVKYQNQRAMDLVEMRCEGDLVQRIKLVEGPLPDDMEDLPRYYLSSDHSHQELRLLDAMVTARTLYAALRLAGVEVAKRK